jgi:hypothetical protein
MKGGTLVGRVMSNSSGINGVGAEVEILVDGRGLAIEEDGDDRRIAPVDHGGNAAQLSEAVDLGVTLPKSVAGLRALGCGGRGWSGVVKVVRNKFGRMASNEKVETGAPLSLEVKVTDVDAWSAAEETSPYTLGTTSRWLVIVTGRGRLLLLYRRMLRRW